MALFFGTTIAVWIYMRHWLNLRIHFPVLTEFQTVGSYELDWEYQQYKCWISNIITFALLAALQALNLFWLTCLLRVLYRFFAHNIAEDFRSEAEESEPENVGDKPDVKEIEPLALRNENAMLEPIGRTRTPRGRKEMSSLDAPRRVSFGEVV